MNLILRLYMII